MMTRAELASAAELHALGEQGVGPRMVCSQRVQEAIQKAIDLTVKVCAGVADAQAAHWRNEYRTKGNYKIRLVKNGMKECERVADAIREVLRP